MNDFFLGMFCGIASLFLLAMIYGKHPEPHEIKYIIIKESQIVKGEK